MIENGLKTGLELTVGDTAQAIAFYTTAFNAVEKHRGCLLDGHPIEAELAVGEYRLRLTEWFEETAAHEDGPELLTYICDNCAEVLGRVVAAGAEIEEPSDDSGGVVVRDPAGQRWIIVSR